MIGLRTLADENPNIHKRLEDLRSIAACILDEVHLLAIQLRPSVLDDVGLPDALKRHISDCQRRYLLNIDLVITGMEQRLPADIETALYRIIQEALTNIIRHAEAQTASIILEKSTNKVKVIIEDDGKGFNFLAVSKNNHGRLGLYGIKERVELLAGQLVVESELEQGTSLFIEIPLG
jgi:signal transduction histidine kinase